MLGPPDDCQGTGLPRPEPQPHFKSTSSPHFFVDFYSFVKTVSLLRRRFLVNADLHLRLLMTSMTIYHFRKVSVRMLLSMLTGKRALVRKWLCQLLWRQHMEPWTRINVDYFNASGLHLMG